MISNHPHLIELGTLRQRVSLGYEYRVAVADNQAQFDAGGDRWTRLAERYLAGVRECIEGMAPDEVRTAMRELEGRLERGLALLDASDNVIEQFDVLLGRYMAASDVLAGLAEAQRRVYALDRQATFHWLYRQRHGKGAGKR